MIKQNYNVVGVMSGTSLDGVDLAHIQFTLNNGRWGFAINEAVTVAYDNPWITRLKAAVSFTADELEKLDEDYTVLLSGIINTFIKNIHRAPDAVCSHGHTIQHQPDKGFTLQIGNRPELADLTGQKIVCDFRVADVALGGQGAPLVPIGDRMLFPDYDYCLNLGGFSNISFEEDGKRVAFDISPVNTVLNYYAGFFGMDYDDKGKIAAGGTVVIPLLEELDELEFYRTAYPKSLGFEFVKEVVIPLIERYTAPCEDKLHTFTVHIAGQIAKVIGQNRQGKLLITGGGAYNDFLIKKIREKLPFTTVAIPDDKTIQYKEALIFGLLGVLRLRGEINVLASVTGALKDHSSGNIFEPKGSRFS